MFKSFTGLNKSKFFFGIGAFGMPMDHHNPKGTQAKKIRTCSITSNINFALKKKKFQIIHLPKQKKILLFASFWYGIESSQKIRTRCSLYYNLQCANHSLASPIKIKIALFFFIFGYGFGSS